MLNSWYDSSYDFWEKRDTNMGAIIGPILMALILVIVAVYNASVRSKREAKYGRRRARRA